MVEVAEALSKGVDFVRVDLYQVGERVVFGELTNYPAAGLQAMTPEHVFSELGRSWNPWQV